MARRLFLDANVLFPAAFREDAGLGRLWELPDATHLITGDLTHFGPYFGETFRDVRVVRPVDLLRD